jgi:amidase
MVIVICAAVFGAVAPALTQPAPSERGPRTFLLSPTTLVAVRDAVRAGSPGYADAMARLRQDAAKAMKAGPFTVMAKAQVPPSGDKHDYMSLARYFWPDPKKPDGLPYVQRDGVTNPEIDTIPDKAQMNGMISAVSTLALAYYLTGEEPYAAKAAGLIRTWYLDPATRMNANLEFGQGVRGGESGRPYGIIDTRGLAEVVDAIGLLEGSPSLTAMDHKGLVAWHSAFLDWLLTSRLGRAEGAGTNNHGVWYDVQVVSMALFTNRTDVARRILEAARTDRVAKQIEPDGSMPRELARTTSSGYTQFNLEAFAALAALGERAGIDLWGYQTPDGRSIRNALAFVLPFVRDGQPWTHKQIRPFDPSTYYPLLVAAAPHYPDLKLLDLADRLGGPAARAHRSNLRFGRPGPPAPPPPPFTIVEATIPEMRAAMEQGRVTSKELVRQYLVRIATYEERLNAVIAVNPKALEEAEARDRERAEKKIRGPLHGIPIALKDNIHTTDMPTTGGALAFEGLIPPYEATLTKNLRDAGAIIIAKTVMTELANWVATGMPGNYSAVGGYGMNPYDPRRDPREATGDGRPVMGTGGSSSGIGTAASLWAANVGTETSGSILSPANANMLVGIKPTVGRVSRYGVIPITADQDTPGPMARTVTDAAIVLGVLEGAAPDPNDAATKTCTPPPNRDYTAYLKAGGLKGARIGIPRASFYERAAVPGSTEPRGGLNPEQAKIMAEAIDILKQQGAVIVDPADIPSIVTTDAKNSFLLWSTCSGLDNAKGKDADCSVVFKYGMKRDFNAWLATLGPAAPVKSLTELRLWNVAHQRAGAIKYGQALLDISDEMDVRSDRARYEADRAKDIRLSAAEGIDAAMKQHQLDALLFPSSSGASIAAKPGYPTVIVPFAFVGVTGPAAAGGPAPVAGAAGAAGAAGGGRGGANAFPAGFEPKPAPYGVSFTGMACSEPKLIEIAYAFEQATKRRVAPKL